MNLYISLKNKELSLELADHAKAVDCAVMPITENLSNELLREIDALLSKNAIKKTEVQKVFVKSDLPDSYTSGRIVKILAKTYQFGSTSL